MYTLRVAVLLAFACSGLLTPVPAKAWLLHEHARIGARAVKRLSPAAFSTLASVWKRAPLNARCEELASVWPDRVDTQNAKSDCISFAALPALAGDHSCFPEDLSQVLKSRWVMQVLKEANSAAEVLAGRSSPSLREDTRRDHDLALQSVDPDYVHRAGGTTAHFQLARTDRDLMGYLRVALATGQRGNASAMYVGYHSAALKLAANAAACLHDDSPECSDRLLRVLLVEAFALHFLQDLFAAGHAVGTWGDDAQRMGTHDYYSRHGVTVRSWDEVHEWAAHGDAFMTVEDLEASAPAVALSLEQLAQMLAGGHPSPELEAQDGAVNKAELIALPIEPDHNSCGRSNVALGLTNALGQHYIDAVFAITPAPTSVNPELPRFRNEFGLYLGGSMTADFGTGGGNEGWSNGVRGRFGASVGVGMESLLTRYLDGRITLEPIVALERFNDNSAVGFGVHIRGPFYAVPGDFVIWAIPALLRANWALRVGRYSAAGRWLGAVPIQFHGAVSENLTLRLGVPRDLTLLYTWERDGREQRRKRTRFIIPIASLLLGRSYSESLATEGSLDLGFEYSHLSGGGYTVGAFLALGGASRSYL